MPAESALGDTIRPIRVTKGSNGTSHSESSRGTARSWVLHDQTLGPERQGPNNSDRRRPSSGRGFRDRAVARPPTTCGTSARDRPVRRRIVGRLERTQSSLGIHRRGACGWPARSGSASRGRPSPYCRYHRRRGSGAQTASGRRCDCNREIHRGDDRATTEAKHPLKALTVDDRPVCDTLPAPMPRANRTRGATLDGFATSPGSSLGRDPQSGRTEIRRRAGGDLTPAENPTAAADRLSMPRFSAVSTQFATVTGGVLIASLLWPVDHSSSWPAPPAGSHCPVD